MPCGGIYPVETSDQTGRCWFDDGSGAELFCEEWDTFLHVRCLLEFLGTEEGRCLLSHGHMIAVPLELWDRT